MPTTILDGQGLRAVMQRYAELLRSHREVINRLNVYPVPDGDTGTNMALTMESVVAEIGDRSELADVCAAVAHGSLMGARGNSGVILSQILRGLTDVLKGRPELDTAALTDGLEEAAAAAYRAVQRPVEGTILTVARESAHAAAA